MHRLLLAAALGCVGCVRACVRAGLLPNVASGEEHNSQPLPIGSAHSNSHYTASTETDPHDSPAPAFYESGEALNVLAILCAQEEVVEAHSQFLLSTNAC